MCSKVYKVKNEPLQVVKSFMNSFQNTFDWIVLNEKFLLSNCATLKIINFSIVYTFFKPWVDRLEVLADQVLNLNYFEGRSLSFYHTNKINKFKF